MSYTRGANPIWLFDDLVGNILDDSYYISFLSNDFPYLPQAVYQDNQGVTIWSQPIQFLANGTLPDNIYGNPSLVYRIEVRQGPTQFDQLIYVINNYVFPEAYSVVSATATAQANQISNPEFSIVNFISENGNPQAPDPQVSFSTAGTYNIAPGWQLILTGTGTCTVTQFITTGSQNSSSQPIPPYYLEITTSGWTTAILQQTLAGNGALWYGNYIAASFSARENDSILSHSLVLTYQTNSPNTEITVIPSATLTGVFQQFTGVVLYPTTSNNTVPNNIAYVTIQIALPTTGITDISDIQVYAIPNLGVVPTVTVQPEQSIQNQINQLSYYYQPQLAAKRIPSYLVGWDFPFNPAQFLGPTISTQATGANSSFYAWDQTIVFQTATSGVSISRGSANEFVMTGAATGQVAIIQYLDSFTARKILNDQMCVNLSAITSISAGLLGTVSLWYTKGGSLPNAAANASLVATLDSNGKPATFNGTWIEVTRTIGQNAQFTLPNSTTTDFPDISFNGRDIAASADANLATFFAIVVGFAPIASTNTININSVSLNSGSIPTRPAPKTFDETLRECQFYYEKSYNNSVVPGANSSLGLISAYQTLIFDSGTTYHLYATPFNVYYNTIKRAVPVIVFYAPDGTINDVSANIYLGATVEDAEDVAVSNWSIGAAGTKSSYYVPANTNALAAYVSDAAARVSGNINFQFVADARLGVV